MFMTSLERAFTASREHLDRDPPRSTLLLQRVAELRVVLRGVVRRFAADPDRRAVARAWPSL